MRTPASTYTSIWRSVRTGGAAAPAEKHHDSPAVSTLKST